MKRYFVSITSIDKTQIMLKNIQAYCTDKEGFKKTFKHSNTFLLKN